jgi:hypothetical protein
MKCSGSPLAHAAPSISQRQVSPRNSAPVAMRGVHQLGALVEHAARAERVVAHLAVAHVVVAGQPRRRAVRAQRGVQRRVVSRGNRAWACARAAPRCPRPVGPTPTPSITTTTTGPLTPENVRFIARLVARDESAFNELVVTYERRVYGLVFRMLGRRDEAEDLAQEVFVQVFKAIDQFRGESKLSTWIYRIAVNLCKNRTKYNQRRHAGEQDDIDAMAERVPMSAARAATSAIRRGPTSSSRACSSR